ncbi:bifunctional (p)ppGpp synthetase/guanosine-3',5'-bis(diphosphate) 3'-pyrophosphohydrolase [Nitrosomonas sp.]|uniref:RelA/SpoT family protein n=1 Tax=Nitrosomonas sp. TaxID=42353 RepID=UPI0026314D4A|nr:bifunctional (p)ppGpp synthetase/guanosine-3',5'-bis(diphosphate) 3'-pyrophosphohydrolase [Nitrosomonas sp.]MCW5599123.1 bifunctional (p)ppGpp synthetase/guanosine-3',5'-bis(diphosphate) 3'-pyrophosphohydrolase [Nitrosomonas sp.]MCW5602551.1 bifunctional (p)ppGpp synthetase/guanosine-3',5'-bis(diphosphate) 3'-pyrophosphohydrolase [Nitrosomonas sp.]
MAELLLSNSPVIAPEAESLFSEVSKYFKSEELALLKNAYFFSQGAHSGQFRKTGEPYISHPVAVASILCQLHLDAITLAAALLHDVLEDTSITKAELSERFGASVAELVDGVSKLEKIEFQTKADAQAENFRKMLLAMAQDVRVILIKLADRLHNMRTLEVMRAEKQRRIARETLEIYAPIAHRLGLNSIYQELLELGFRYFYPNRYKVLLKATKAARGNRREVVGKILEAIKQRLEDAGVDAIVTGREKHLYSIYKKMVEKQLSFSEVLDIYGFRVLVRDIPSCYLALGALHSLYKPIPGKFKDYIAIPKLNGYQSLHNTLLGPYGLPIEVQIRTYEMHRIAEMGVASHWLYKSNSEDINDLHLKTNQWLKSLLEILSDTSDSIEFLEHLKVDLFPGEVYVFTPQGKILELPRGSTAVDFAYAIHTDVGNCCVAAKINGENAPLRTKLKNGDRVEILTAPYANPNPAWLSYVATGRARSSIRYFLRTIQFDESVKLGERLLNQALSSFGIDPETINDTQWERLVRESGAKSKKALLADIALGKQLSAVLAKRLVVPGESVSEISSSSNPVTILGTEGMTVQFARCCYPIPGDTIVGLIKKDQGLVIHSHDCPAVARIQKNAENVLDVTWGKDISRTFEVGITMTVVNQRGVLARVAAEIAKADSNIDDVTMESDKDYTTMHFILQTKNRQHLAQIMRNLRHIKEIVRLSRVRN